MAQEQEPPRSPQPKQATTHGPRGGKNNAWKWLAGAAAAVAVIGGGLFAWTHRPQTESTAEAVYNEPGADGSYGSSASSGGSGVSTAPGATAESASSEGPASQRAKAARIHEETIGVGPTRRTTQASAAPSATRGEENEINVPGPRTVWTRKPSERRLSAYYPTRALERGREGQARLRCRVDNGGALDCVRVSETPAHAGFGTAALRVARLYRHGPRHADGSRAYGSNLNLRVVFRIADDDRRRRG